MKKDLLHWGPVFIVAPLVIGALGLSTLPAFGVCILAKYAGEVIS